MKTVLTCLCMLAISATASASSIAENMETCKAANNVAEGLMSSRQHGVSMMTIMDITAKGGEVTGYMMRMINEAYSTPAYYTEGAQNSAILDFANDKYLECMEIMSK